MDITVNQWLKEYIDKSQSLAKRNALLFFQGSYVEYPSCSSCIFSTSTMRSLFFFWLTFLLTSISHLSLADFDPFQIPALQADDAVTTAPTPELVVDDPSLALGIGAQDDSVRIPVDSAETNQQQQGFLEANTSKCPPSNSGAKRRRRDDLNYCRNEDAPTIRPAPSQQGQKVPPSGNLGGQSKPGNNPLATPEEARPEWAPSFHEFFVRDPCEKRPYQVCAPYMPGRDFEEWTSTARALPSFNLPACDFC